MAGTLYIDTLFCANWMMDSVTLIVTGRLLRRQIRMGPVTVAAAVGSVWACGYTMADWQLEMGKVLGLSVGSGAGYGLICAVLWLANWFLIPWIMIRLAYPDTDFRRHLRGVICLYLATVVLGGLMHMILERTVAGKFWRLWMSDSSAGSMALWLLTMAMAGSFAAVEFGLRYRYASSRQEQIQEITLYFGENVCSVKALWDSGNQLCDPFTGNPVHILENKTAQQLLGENTYHGVMAYCDGTAACETVHLIPCRSLGRAHMLIPVFTADQIRLADGSILEKPVIGLSAEPLSTDDSYQMLLHGQISTVENILWSKTVKKSFVRNNDHGQTK